MEKNENANETSGVTEIKDDYPVIPDVIEDSEYKGEYIIENGKCKIIS